MVPAKDSLITSNRNQLTYLCREEKLLERHGGDHRDIERSIFAYRTQEASGVLENRESWATARMGDPSPSSILAYFYSRVKAPGTKWEKKSDRGSTFLPSSDSFNLI